MGQNQVKKKRTETADIARHRLRVEHAVVRASLLLSASGELDYDELLETIGESTGVECVYFQMVPPDDQAATAFQEEKAGVNLVVWYPDGQEMPGGGLGGRVERLTAFDMDADVGAGNDVTAVPVLSSSGRFYGYLGIVHPRNPGSWNGEDARLLHVVGDMLAGFLERRRVEEALQENEERLRVVVENHPEPILILKGDRIVYVNPSGSALFGMGDENQILGRSLFDFVSAEEYNRISQHIEQPARHKPLTPLQYEVTRSDGEWRIVESISVPVKFRGEPATQLVLRDLTERRKSEYRYRTFVETISEGIWHVEFLVPISGVAKREMVEEHIEKQSRLTECNRVMSQMLGADEPGELTGRNLWEILPFGRFLEAFVRADYKVRNWPISLTDSNGHTRHLVLNAVGTVERSQLVGIWGSCIEVTETVELERRMVNALEEQQQQIGRELHDGVGQLLTGIRMLTNVLVDRFGNRGGEDAELANKIMKFAEEASQQVRSIYYGLTPAQLSMDGLASALEELAVNTDTIPAIRCTFAHDNKTDVTDLQTKLHLYRIAQEAINNALKHARATKIDLSLLNVEGNIEVMVTDNGIGFDPGRKGNTKSLGIKSMYYRAHAIRADLLIETVREGGTVIRCMLPLSA